MSEQMQKKSLIPEIVEASAPLGGRINPSKVWKSLIFTVAVRKLGKKTPKTYTHFD
jgi:hypothetical protein